MTTENTDAGIRILTKTIRKLTEQLAEADEQQGRAHRKRQDAENELMDVRAKLDPNGAHTFPRYLFTLPAETPPPRETVVQLTEKRMAELADAHKDLDAANANAKQFADRVDELRARIDQALCALPTSLVDEVDFAPIAKARAILRGES